jgi:hypothetical protein
MPDRLTAASRARRYDLLFAQLSMRSILSKA